MHSGVVDRVRQPIHPVGNTTITEKSSVRPQEQYRDVKPLTFAMRAAVDSDKKRRFVVWNTELAGGRWLALCFFCIMLRG